VRPERAFRDSQGRVARVDAGHVTATSDEWKQIPSAPTSDEEHLRTWWYKPIGVVLFPRHQPRTVRWVIVIEGVPGLLVVLLHVGKIARARGHVHRQSRQTFGGTANLEQQEREGLPE